jgi:hypothetical protein
MTALQTHAEQPRTGGATAKSITLPSGPTLAVGDDMYLAFAAGGDYDGASSGATPAGWSIVEQELFGVNVSVHQTVFHRVCQSGDPGSVVTVPDTVAALGKTVLMLVVVRSVNSSGPIQDSSKSHETTSSVTHATPTATVTNAGKVLQFIAMKDGTASTTLTLPGTYDVIARATTGGGTAPIVAGTAISHADIAAGTAGSVNWTSDQASANASMIAVVIDLASTVVGVRTSSDITVPSGATFGGGATTLFGAHGDDDPNTYARFIVSGSAQVEEEKFPALPGPLTGYTGKLILDGATTTTVVVRLVQNTTVLYTGSGHTITAAGEQSFHDDFDAGVQATETDLTNLRIRKSYTGS